MWFKINFNRLVRWLLPPILRRAVVLAMLESMVTPLKDLYTSFITWRGGLLRRMGVRGSADVLEKIINENIGMPNGVQILSENNAKRYFLYMATETNRPVYIGRTGSQFYLKNRYVLASVANFVVRIPRAVCTDIDPSKDEYKGLYLSMIIDILDLYKPAGRKYRIELY